MKFRRTLAEPEEPIELNLIPLIDSGQLAGATLDVFQQEPLPAEHPFWRHRRSP